MGVYRTVILKGQLGRRYEEARAGVACRPGFLITEYSDAGVLKVRPHATAGGGNATAAAVKVAVEDNGFQGTTIRDTIAIGELVRYVTALPGEILAMWVPAAAAAIVLGDVLTSNGDGTLKKANGTTDKNLFQAMEALDNSAGGTQAQIKVAVL